MIPQLLKLVDNTYSACIDGIGTHDSNLSIISFR